MTRLKDMTPEGVATEVVRLLGERMSMLEEALSLESVGIDPDDWELTKAGRVVQRLTAYAQTGQAIEISGMDVDAATASGLVLSLWCSFGAVVPDSAGQIATVIDAARCRAALDRGEVVTSRDLAALGSVSKESMRTMCSRGNGPESLRGLVEHADAVEWLAGRGVGW